MTTARELFLTYSQALNDHDVPAAAALFAEGGVLDYPSLPSIGMAPNIVGRQAIRTFLTDLLAQVPDFAFYDLEILIDTPDRLLAEYKIDATMTTGRPFKQHYGGFVVVSHGKIDLLREYLDNVHVARALLPEGTASIPA